MYFIRSSVLWICVLYVCSCIYVCMFFYACMFIFLMFICLFVCLYTCIPVVFYFLCVYMRVSYSAWAGFGVCVTV